MPFIDLRKQYGALYKPSANAPALVEVPPLRFLMVDGMGPVGADSEPFQQAASALFSLSYSTKFAAKKRLEISYPVMPLESLTWDAEEEPASEPPLDTPSHLAWRLMILLPQEVPGELAEEVRARIAAKKDLPRLLDIRVQTFSEGTSVQILHKGPYAAETAVRLLRAFAEERGYRVTGSHHEVYLSDPQRSTPDKMKAILRYAVRKSR